MFLVKNSRTYPSEKDAFFICLSITTCVSITTFVFSVDNDFCGQYKIDCKVILSFSHSRSRLLEEEEAAKAFQVRKKEAEEREKQRLEEERKKKEAEEKATIDRITLEAGNNVAYVI